MLVAAVLALLAGVLLPGGAAADQASQPTAPVAGSIATGNFHSCAVISFAVRCWGYGGDGALGYGNTATVGAFDTPAVVGPVFLGAGRAVAAIAAGSVHTCALLDNGTVRCWGFGANGRLGYGNTNTVGDDETPGALPSPVDLGAGRTAKAVTAGDGHTCAILEDDTVRCWGFNLDGRLGYGHTDAIGDNEPAGSGGPVNLGPGRTARAIAAGGSHTCALLDNGTVRCWGFGGFGRLGYGKNADIGRSPDATPETVGPVDLGAGRTARALTAGYGHTCAILDNGTVLCWGFNGSGRLGYGDTEPVGDDELPGMVTPVDLGAGRTARAIHAGNEHTCALLDDGSVRCWGAGGFGRLGYGDARSIGDNEPPGSVGPVQLGTGRTATAISAGFEHTCARLDDGSVRCWGTGTNGRLGYCNEIFIGDDEVPAAAGPVALGLPAIPGAQCPPGPPAPPPPPADEIQPPSAAPPPPPAPATKDPLAAALAAQRERTKSWNACIRTARSRLNADRRRARLFSRARSARELRGASARYRLRRRACVRRHGRLPGRVTGLKAAATGGGKVVLTFQAAGTDGRKAPAAQNYVIKQSTRPIRTRRDFDRGVVLCGGKCAFDITSTDSTVDLTVTRLQRSRLYHYAVAARDNVSSRMGPRSRTVSVRVR